MSAQLQAEHAACLQLFDMPRADAERYARDLDNRRPPSKPAPNHQKLTAVFLAMGSMTHAEAVAFLLQRGTDENRPGRTDRDIGTAAFLFELSDRIRELQKPSD